MAVVVAVVIVVVVVVAVVVVVVVVVVPSYVSGVLDTLPPQPPIQLAWTTRPL